MINHRTDLFSKLGRHREREGKVKGILCGVECGSVMHVLWECPAYSSCVDWSF